MLQKVEHITQEYIKSDELHLIKDHILYALEILSPWTPVEQSQQNLWSKQQQQKQI